MATRNDSPEQLYFVDLSEGLEDLTRVMGEAPRPVTIHRAGGRCIWVRAGGNPGRVKDWARFADAEMAHAAGDDTTMVPTKVLRWPGISMPDKSIYTLILSYAQESTRHAPASLQVLHEAGCSGPEFWRYLRELADAGLLALEDRGLGRDPRIIFKRPPGYLWGGRRGAGG